MEKNVLKEKLITLWENTVSADEWGNDHNDRKENREIFDEIIQDLILACDGYNPAHESSGLHLQSVIHWVAVADRLPELEKNVMIVCKDGYVGWGMRAERVIYERSKTTGLYERTDKKQIEWGYEENGFEYWNKIDDVMLWADFPEPPCV